MNATYLNTKFKYIINCNRRYEGTWLRSTNGDELRDSKGQKIKSKLGAVLVNTKVSYVNQINI